MWKTLVFLALLPAAWAQEDNIRQIWKRPISKPKAVSAEKPTKVAYRPVEPQATAPNSTSSTSRAILGLTVWKLRPPKPNEEGARLLMLQAKTAERVDTSTELKRGDEVRLAVEVPSDGYLYVIDRERIKDTLGPAHLIYPNAQTRSGDNRLGPGRVIEIPDQRDEIKAFTLDSSAGQTAEELTLLVTPEPMAGMKAGLRPLKLDPMLFAGWEKQWRAEIRQFDLTGEQGKLWTEREKIAGADHSTTLNSDDPLPQTMYEVNVKPGQPFLVTVPLKIKQ